MGKDANRRDHPALKTRFARLDHDLLSSAAYRALTPNARSLLNELAMIYNTKNNGDIYLSVRDAAARMGVTDLSAASTAFADLMTLGFIDLTVAASFTSRADAVSKARCWRLTWQPAPGMPATYEYRDAIVTGKRAQARSTAGRLALQKFANGNYRGAKSDTGKPLAVAESRTLTGNCQITDPLAVAKSNTGNSQKPPISVETDRSGFRHTSSIATTRANAGSLAGDQSMNGLVATPAIPAAQLNALRADLVAHLNRLGHGAQSVLAEESGVGAPIISKFRHGDTLPSKYFVPLRMAVAEQKPASARKAA